MKEMELSPIGVFDSGVGGLTVIRELETQLPQENYIYYADTAHVPYGSREPQELKGFAQTITAFLVEQGCKMIVIACNTSTSLAYEELVSRFAVPIIGVIEPGVDGALKVSKNEKIGIIGTLATVNSGAYQRIIKKKNPQAEVVAVPCPRFVPLVEEGQVEGPEVDETAHIYLKPLQEKGVDTLILGCTHYPFLRPVIERIMGKGVNIIDPAWETVRRAGLSLQNLGLVNRNEDKQFPIFYASGDPESFRKTGSRFLGRDLGPVKGISLS
jgi:glutamate racemase